MKKRLRCCVPFCNRTRKPDEYAEWICGKHWPLTDLQSRLVYRRMKFRRPGPEFAQARGRIWDRLRRQAIERAAGL